MNRTNPPAWVNDAIAYQIMPRCFAAPKKPSQYAPLYDTTLHPPGWYRGDINGITEHLHHIEDLGANLILLNPITLAKAPHQYDVVDMKAIDPSLGGRESLERLIRQAGNIRIMLDVVLGHASIEEPGFKDATRRKNSPHTQNYQIWGPIQPQSKGHKRGYACWSDGFSDYPHLVRRNFTHPKVINQCIDTLCYFADMGISGFRFDSPLDGATDINKQRDAWATIQDKIIQKFPNLYLVAELWSTHDADLFLPNGIFQGIQNYAVTQTLEQFLIGNIEFHERQMLRDPHSYINADQFNHQITQLYTRYPHASHLNMVGSHDTVRLRRRADNQYNQNRQSVIMMINALMTLPGVPCIYYGDEIGMDGGSDPDNRRMFDWNTENWDKELFKSTKQAILQRKLYHALRSHSIMPGYDNHDSSLLIRKTPQHTTLVGMNRGWTPAKAPYHYNEKQDFFTIPPRSVVTETIPYESHHSQSALLV